MSKRFAEYPGDLRGERGRGNRRPGKGKEGSKQHEERVMDKRRKRERKGEE